MRMTKRKVSPMLPLLDFAAPAKPQPAPQPDPDGPDPDGPDGDDDDATQTISLSEACSHASSTAYPD